MPLPAPAMTSGTKLSALSNLAAGIVGTLMMFNWDTVISHPSASAGIVTGLGFLNTILHLFTGNSAVGAPK